jgi:hypothetical protein
MCPTPSPALQACTVEQHRDDRFDFRTTPAALVHLLLRCPSEIEATVFIDHGRNWDGRSRRMISHNDARPYEVLDETNRPWNDGYVFRTKQFMQASQGSAATIPIKGRLLADSLRPGHYIDNKLRPGHYTDHVTVILKPKDPSYGNLTREVTVESDVY